MKLNSLGLALGLIAASSSASALNIALTNDDGWDSGGIQSLYDALIAAGHTVTLVGSSENQSGSSGAIDLGQGNVVVTKEREMPGGDQFSAALSSGSGAEPATAGQIAISIAESYGPVDLLVSGTNSGANIGAFTNVSGTVGAAVHGISLISGERLPSIAISTNEPQPLRECPAEDQEACEAANEAHYDVVSSWFVDFLHELEGKPGTLRWNEGLLPDGIGLNINYPVTDQIQGVTLNVQGMLPMVQGIYRGLPMGCYSDCNDLAEGDSAPAGIAGVELLDGEDVKLADTTSFSAGYVTIVPIQADLSVPVWDFVKFRPLVRKLN